MKCCTSEELAGIALGIDQSRPPHIDECPACAAKLAALKALSAQLTELHADTLRGHAAARARLTARLSTSQLPEPATIWWRRPARGWPLSTLWQRFALGGVCIRGQQQQGGNQGNKQAGDHGRRRPSGR